MWTKLMELLLERRRGNNFNVRYDGIEKSENLNWKTWNKINRRFWRKKKVKSNWKKILERQNQLTKEKNENWIKAIKLINNPWKKPFIFRLKLNRLAGIVWMDEDLAFEKIDPIWKIDDFLLFQNYGFRNEFHSPKQSTSSMIKCLLWCLFCFWQ